MKKGFLIYTILFSCFFSTMGQKISIANDRENILYAGVNNPISIAAENYSCKKLIVKTDNGKIYGSNCSYTFHSNKVGPCEIIIYQKYYGKLKEIGRTGFRVKTMPLPKFKIGSGKDSMRMVEISNQQYVRADLENFDIAVRYSVEQFTVSIISNDTSGCTTKSNIGSQISDEIKHLFAMLKPNDIVLFRDIYVLSPNDTLALLKPVMIKIY